MTRSTSEVAVCCSSASESSRVRACTSSNSRTFSIAITAWSAKVVTSSICFSVNGCTACAQEMTPIGVPSRSSGTQAWCECRRFSLARSSVFRIGEDVGDVDGPALRITRPTIVPRPGGKRLAST